MEREFVIAGNILSSPDIFYTGSTKNTSGEYIAHFDIEGKRYDYYLILKDMEIMDWMKRKKKLSDLVLLNYVKKKAYEVYKDKIKIQSETIKKKTRKVVAKMEEYSQMCVEFSNKEKKLWSGAVFLQRVTFNRKKFKEIQEDGVKFGLYCGRFENDVNSLKKLGNLSITSQDDFSLSTYSSNGIVMTNGWEVSFEDGNIEVFEQEMEKMLKKYSGEFKRTCNIKYE